MSRKSIHQIFGVFFFSVGMCTQRGHLKTPIHQYKTPNSLQCRSLWKEHINGQKILFCHFQYFSHFFKFFFWVGDGVLHSPKLDLLPSVRHVKLYVLYGGGDGSAPQDVLVWRRVVGGPDLWDLVQETVGISRWKQQFSFIFILKKVI